MTDTDLFSADLRGADLRGADLRDANLKDWMVRRIQEIEAALRIETRLDNVPRTSPDLTEVVWSEETLWPPTIAKGIRQQSRELRPGIWEVVGPGNYDAEMDAPLTPRR